MKVGVYIGNRSPAAGGAYTFQNEILKSLQDLCDASSHEFMLFCLHPETGATKTLPQNLKLSDYRRGFLETAHYRLSKWFPWLPLTHSSMLDRFAKKAGVQFMWFVGNDYVPTDLPYICTIWDLQHRLQPWFPEVSSSGVWESREKHYSRMLQCASIIITGTEVGKNEIVHFYSISPNNIRVLPHPTPRFALDNHNQANPSLLLKYGIPKDFLFYPAQFWPHKNHAGLLTAVNMLRQKHNLAMPVVFTGADHGNINYIKKMVNDLDLKDQVHFLGVVPLEDLAELYRQALALIYVTFFGPENLPPLEAFGFGCPTIASNVSGAEEQLGDAVWFVDPRNHEQIADTIYKLYCSPEQRQLLITKGKLRAEKWTAVDFVRGIFTILDEFENFACTWES